MGNKCTCGRETHIAYHMLASTYREATVAVANVPIDSCSYCDLHYGLARPSDRVKDQMNRLIAEAYNKGVNEINYTEEN